jgi:hypothetical protein
MLGQLDRLVCRRRKARSRLSILLAYAGLARTTDLSLSTAAQGVVPALPPPFSFNSSSRSEGALGKGREKRRLERRQHPRRTEYAAAGLAQARGKLPVPT